MKLNSKSAFPSLTTENGFYLKILDIAKGTLICAIVLSVFIFFFEHSIKYLLFIFGLSLSIILILFVYYRDFRFKLRIPSSKFIDYFFILNSILIFTIHSFLESPNEILFPFFIIASLFLPGWVFIRLLGIKDSQGLCLSDLCLSFVLSVGLSSIIFLLVSQLGLETGKILLGIYVIISLLPLLKEKIFKLASNQKSKYVIHKEFGIFEVLIIGWITLFFITIISVMYPETAYEPDLDIVKHFSQSNEILNSPETYGSIYPIFHSILATVNVLSSAPMWLLQSGIAYLSIIVVFSFYIMAKSYLKHLNTLAPLLATIFFFIFSGFGWIYYVLQRINLAEPEKYFSILLSSIRISYSDTQYGLGPFLWLWFRPVTLGFIIFFVMLYLLNNENLSKRNYIIITSLLVGFLAGIHFSELAIFILLISALAIFKPGIKLRLKETIVSILIGLVIWTILIFSYQYFFDSQYVISSLQYIVPLGILSVISLVLITFIKRISFVFKINSVLIATIALFVYGVLLFSWLNKFEEYSSFKFLPNYLVPWDYYPVLLGIIGGIALVGGIIVAKKYRNQQIILFLILFILVIVVGKVISYVNLNFFDTGYFERRFILVAYIAAAILASIGVTYLFNRIKRLEYRIIKSLLVGSLISLLVLAGIFSTFLSIEYNILRIPRISLTNNEIFLLNHLNQTEPLSMILTVSQRSKLISSYEDLEDVVVNYRDALWASKSPEQTLHVISTLNGSTTILLSPKDLNKISKNYDGGYISSHILRVVPVLYEGPEGKIFTVPPNSSPLPKSNVALVLSEDSKEFYYAYDILSLGGYNYTTILISDLNSLQEASVVIAPNEELALKLIDYREDNKLKFTKLIVLKIDDFESILINKNNNSKPSLIIEGDDILFSNNIKNISGEHEIIFPDYLVVNEILFDSDFVVKSYYHPSVPFHLYKEYDGFDMNYFNINPIIKKLKSDDKNSRDFYKYLGDLLKFSELELPRSKLTAPSIYVHLSEGVATFKKIIFKGDIMLESDSAIINMRNNTLLVNVGNSTLEIENVTKILPYQIEKVLVRSSNGVLKDGIGFYSKISLNQSSVQFIGQPAKIFIVDSTGSIHTISSEEIEINLLKSTYLIRQPKITSDGITKFENFYGFGKIPRKVRFVDENFQIIGTTILNIKFSDIFTISKANSFSGGITTEP